MRPSADAVRARAQRPMFRWTASFIAATVFTTTACATVLPIQQVGDIAGTWQGRVSNRWGNGTATMTIEDDGSYRGTTHLDGGDRAFSGTIIVVGPSRVRYQGIEGNGFVRLLARNGTRTLKFLLDDGGITATFAPAGR